MVPAEPRTVSANINQGVRPAVSQTTKGTLFMGLDLKPTLKTNQKTVTITRGLIKVQTKPRKEPTYWVVNSLLVIEMIKFF
jgi:hypothetical protein